VARDPKFDDGFSEMIPAPPSAAIGHNQGPEWLPIGKELEDRLKAAHKKAIKRAKDLADAAPIDKVENKKHLKDATERVRQYQASLTELDGQRKSEKEPYRLGGAQVDGFFNEPAEDLALLKIALERKMNAYNSKVAAEERRRLARELAEKQQAEELKRKQAAALKAKADALAEKAKEKKTIAKAAATRAEAEEALDDHEALKAEVTNAERALNQPAANLTRARSANAVSSQQEFVDFRDVNREKISLESLRNHLGIDAIAMALRSYVRANNDAIKEDIKNRRQPLAGVEFFMNSSTRVGGG
jgi:hypothetical protein